MDDPGSAGKGGGALNSGNGADFVKKLYRMLADKTHSNVVRWSDHGKSFIVFDNNDFTKNVLPQHFKHSNFASFVRQLNKYDFHKVRASEDTLPGPNGDQAWEFVHPQFRLGNDNNLEGIKRKAPSQRKKGDEEPQLTMDSAVNTQQLQSRLDEVFRRVEGMVQQYHNAVSEILSLNRRMHRTEEMLEKIMFFQQNGHYPPSGHPGGPPPGMHPDANYLDAHGHPAHQQPGPPHLHERMMAHPGGPGGPPSGGPSPPIPMHGYPGAPPPGSHGAVTPVQQAAERYSVGRELPPGTHSLGPYVDGPGTPIPDAVHLSGFGNTASISGIALDATDPQVSTTFRQDVRRPQGLRKKSTGFVAPRWREQPKVLLVEDDATCRKIGLKFLEATGCLAYHASDGYEAIRKFNDANGPKYDLILMDIVMPNLDGVSTCQIIRGAKPDMKDPPIIAMTSNIRTSDINLYFAGGMIDVLPKPFTKDGLRQMLEKYLSRLRIGSTEDPPSLPSKQSLALQSASGGYTPNTSKAESNKQSTSPILKTEYDNTTNSHGDDNDDDDDDISTGMIGQDTPQSSIGIIQSMNGASGGVGGGGGGEGGGGSIDGNGDYTFNNLSGDDLTPSNTAGFGGTSEIYESGNISTASSSRTLRRPPEPGVHDDYSDGRLKRMRFNAA